MTAEIGLFLLAGLAGGVVNAAAGGAKLFVFPLLLASGLPPLMANATGTVALWPAQLPAAWVYRAELMADRRAVLRHLVPAVIGSLAGAIALIHSPEQAFVAAIPALLGIAVVAIVFGKRLADFAQHALSGRRLGAATGLLMFLCGFYGGYFGAGMGFMLLAVITLAGVASILRANAEKNFVGVCINSTAVVPLAFSGLVDWLAAVSVLIGGLAGGYLGGRLTRLVPEMVMRIGVAVVGVVLTASFLLR
jgi:uncharacterized membrane protein YfcA